MRRAVLVLCLLSGLLMNSQARANPANCDGDMTPDQTEFLEYVVGLHPILFGGPVSIMRTCERVKKFLSTLSSLGISRRTESVSSEQARSALEGMRAGPGNVSSCLNFDAAACKRYLGIGDSAPTVAETPTAPARTPLTIERAKIKRDELRLKDLELANNLVRLCKSITSEQACVARLLAIENLRDDVARWNQDPELMAFIPPIIIDSPDLIAQTGWERGSEGWYNRAGNKADREVCPELTKLINSLVANAPERARERLPEFRSTCAERDPSYAAWLPRWEARLAGTSARAGTKGGAYVRPEDCERLSRQIDADLQARPNEEPPSLSFFEVECAGANVKHAEQVASWKQAISGRKATEALNQWDGGIRQAEAEQRKAKEEEERRVGAQKSAEEERLRLAAQRKHADDEAAARQPASGNSIDECKSYEQSARAACMKVYGADSPTCSLSALAMERRIATQRLQDPREAARQIERARNMIQEHANPRSATEELSLAAGRVQLCMAQQARSSSLAADTASTRAQQSPASRPQPPATSFRESPICALSDPTVCSLGGKSCKSPRCENELRLTR